MRAGLMVGRPEHGPYGDGEQGRGQDGPGDELLLHQAKSVQDSMRPVRHLSCTAKRCRRYELLHSRTALQQITNPNDERLPAARIDPACPAKTTSKANPIWVVSTAASPASPSRHRVRAKALGMKTSWQNAAPVQPIGRSRRPRQEIARRSPAGNGGLFPPLPRLAGEDDRGRQKEAGTRRLESVLDLLGHRLVAHHQRHHVRHHHRAPGRRVRRGSPHRAFEMSLMI